jgi:hypothetical protein
MHRKCYKSVILPLVIRNDPLIALAKIAWGKQHCKPKNYPNIFPLARLLAHGNPMVGVMGKHYVLRAGGRLHRETDTFLILWFHDSHSPG